MSKVDSCVAQEDLRSVTMPEIYDTAFGKRVFGKHIFQMILFDKKNIATYSDGGTHGLRLNLQMCCWFLMFLNKLFKMTYN